MKMKCLMMSVAAVAMAANAADSSADVLSDAVLSDFPRLAGETDDAPRFRRAAAAAPNGVLAIPKGDYAIASPIVVTNRCSLERLYEGPWKNVAWRDSSASGGANMAADTKKFTKGE